MQYVAFIYKYFKRILFVVVALATIIFVLSCSPQKRLNWLVKNNPELAKTDTSYQIKTIEVPGVDFDTTFKASTNTNQLAEILDHYKNVIDSLTRQKLNAEIKNYIINRPCLEKPLTIDLKNGAYCTISQTNGVFSVVYKDPPKKYQIKVPVVIMRVEAVRKYNWQMFIGGSFFTILLSICLFTFFKPKSNG